MNIRTWIVTVIFLVWGALCWNWYTCVIKGFCGGNRPETYYKPKVYEPAFKFSKSSFECVKDKGFNAFSDSVKQLISEGKTILITGLFDIKEINKSSFKNLGLARAFSIKSQLASETDTSKIHISSRPFDLAIENESFTAYETTIEINENSDDNEGLKDAGQPAIEAEPGKGDNNIENKPAATGIFNKTVDGAVIFFEQNEIHYLPDTEIEAYLSKLAEELKSNGKKINITGYTANTESINLRRIRAWVVKKALLDKGVNSEQLITRGLGSDKAEMAGHSEKYTRVEITSNKN